MYPVHLGFSEAESRIKSLIAHGHHAEALLTTAFTAEKTVRRSLKALMVMRGIRNKDADILVPRQGFDALTKVWPVFDPDGRSLADRVHNPAWSDIKAVFKMRNDIVHGTRVFPLGECREKAEKALAGIANLRMALTAAIGYDGWTRVPIRRRSELPMLGSLQGRIGPASA